jgi:hypothetical protein
MKVGIVFGEHTSIKTDLSTAPAILAGITYAPTSTTTQNGMALNSDARSHAEIPFGWPQNRQTGFLRIQTHQSESASVVHWDLQNRSSARQLSIGVMAPWLNNTCCIDAAVCDCISV